MSTKLYPTIHLSPAESEHLLYSPTVPADALAEGLLVGIEDFHQAAAAVRTSIAVGTRVMKEVAQDLYVGNELPFNLVWRLNGGTNGVTIYLDEGQVTARLQDYYIRTQSLYTHFNQLSKREAVRLYGTKGRLVLQAVLYDETDDELVTTIT